MILEMIAMRRDYVSPEELIQRMEHNAHIVMNNFGREKAKQAMEQMAHEAEAVGHFDENLRNGFLAMAAKLDELLSK